MSEPQDEAKPGEPAGTADQPAPDSAAPPAASPSPPADAGAASTPQTPAPDAAAVERYQPVADYFRDTPGVAASTIDHGRDWLVTTYGTNGGKLAPGDEKPRHPYDFRQFEAALAPKDRAYLHAFGNHMAKGGAGEMEVYALLRRYTDQLMPAVDKHQRAEREQSVAASREIEAEDRNDVSTARETLRAEWGNDYGRNIRAINLYLDALPQAEREQIEGGMVDGGTSLLLNQPDYLKDLLQKARTAGPTSGAAPAAGSRAALDAKIAELAKLRHSDPKAYYARRDEYIGLLRERDGG